MSRERSFKDYVADRFYNELYDGIREFIKENPQDLDLKLHRVQDIDDIDVSDMCLWMSMTNREQEWLLM